MKRGEFLSAIGSRISRAPGRAIERVLFYVARRADEDGAVELSDALIARAVKCHPKTVQRARTWAIEDETVEAEVGTGRRGTVWRFLRSILSTQGGHEGGHHARRARETMRDTRRKPRVDRGARRITKAEVDRIRDAVRHHRPEWDPAGVCSVVYRFAKQGAGPERIEAVLSAVARDPNTRTPGQALQRGPWHDEGSEYRTGPAPILRDPKPAKPFLPTYVPAPVPGHGRVEGVRKPLAELWAAAGGREALRARRAKLAT